MSKSVIIYVWSYSFFVLFNCFFNLTIYFCKTVLIYICTNTELFDSIIDKLQ